MRMEGRRTATDIRSGRREIVAPLSMLQTGLCVDVGFFGKWPMKGLKRLFNAIAAPVARLFQQAE